MQPEQYHTDASHLHCSAAAAAAATARVSNYINDNADLLQGHALRRCVIARSRSYMH